MASTYPTIERLYREALLGLSARLETWEAFLASAGRNYKLPFHEQVLVFAQRPDAKAVLTLEGWNRLFGRKVKRGSTGIAVFGAPGSGRLNYYFDISDTVPTEAARAVPLWSVAPEDAHDIVQGLRERFGAHEDGGCENALEGIAAAILRDGDPLAMGIADARAGGGLGKLEEAEAQELFLKLAAASAAYEATSRCGLSPLAPAISSMEEALRPFDTVRSLNALGCAATRAAETMLREIASTARDPQRHAVWQNRTIAHAAGGHHNPSQKTTERSQDGAGPLPRAEERRPFAEVNDRRGPGPEHGAVRDGPGRIPESQQASAESEPTGRGGIGVAPERHGAPGSRNGRPDRAAHGDEPTGGRTPESGKPDKLGGENERDQRGGTLNRDARNNLRVAGGRTAPANGTETLEAGNLPASSVSRGKLPQANQEQPHPGKVGRKTAAPLERLRGNIQAIECLAAIEKEGRQATAPEQTALAEYVGWGGLADVFDESSPKWAAERERLRMLLTEEEWSAARASTLTAFYTPPEIVRPIWEAIEAMGFAGGSVLEPSCGTGAFFRGMPESLAGSRLVGVELDSLTARIARASAPGAEIIQGKFEHAHLDEESFDIAVGNVPFGSYQADDPRYRGEGLLVHDYFFARALELVRPGGVVAFVTSKGTLDKKNGTARRRLAEKAELLGAVRLPSTAFAPHTKVTTDIVVLQKRARPEACEPEWVHTERTEAGIDLNSYFVSHPEMVLGELVAAENAYGRTDVECREKPGDDLEANLRGALGSIAASMPTHTAPDQAPSDGSIPADPRVRDWSYARENGTIYFRMGARMFPQNPAKTASERILGMMDVRDCTRRLIELERDDAPKHEIEAARADLNVLYDTYTAKHGILSSRANAAAFRQDSSYPLLCALEVLDEDGGLARKADILSKRTIRPSTPIDSADTPQEALAVSLAEKGRVDLPFMSKLTGISEKEVVAKLAGQIFRVPDAAPGGREWQAADEYLSGNVRSKLRTAEAAAAADPAFRSNAEALRAAMPPEIDPADISVRLGATWIPPDDVRDFVIELLEPPTGRAGTSRCNTRPSRRSGGSRARAATAPTCALYQPMAPAA